MDDTILSAQSNSPMAQPIDVGGFVVGNRWCVHPMEGWDGTTTGEPTEHTVRRWKHFGESGCKLIWGGEAFAVQGDGRANPNQLGIVDDDVDRAEKGVRTPVRNAVSTAHRASVGTTDDLLVGLQLTHSGRFCRPYDKKKLAPKIAYHHPILDPKFGIDRRTTIRSSSPTTKSPAHRQLRPRRQARAARRVSVRRCQSLSRLSRPRDAQRLHPPGNIRRQPGESHALLSRDRSQAIQAECPGLMIGVRLSVFDHPPFKPDPAQRRREDSAREFRRSSSNSSRTTTASAAIRTIRWRWI